MLRLVLPFEFLQLLTKLSDVRLLSPYHSPPVVVGVFASLISPDARLAFGTLAIAFYLNVGLA